MGVAAAPPRRRRARPGHARLRLLRTSVQVPTLKIHAPSAFRNPGGLGAAHAQAWQCYTGTVVAQTPPAHVRG